MLLLVHTRNNIDSYCMLYIIFAQQLPLARTLYNLAVLLLKERPVRILYLSVDLPRRKHLCTYLPTFQ